MSPGGIFVNERSITHADHSVNRSRVLNVLMMSAYSDAVYAAQAALQARRQSLQKPPASLDEVDGKDGFEVSITAVIRNLPPHLGWCSTAVSQHLRRKEIYPAEHSEHRKVVELVKQPAAETPEQSHLPQHVRHYPDLGIAALHAKRVPHYQLWLTCRLLDTNGRGWLSTQVVIQQVAGQDAPLRLFGKRRLRQVLQGGNGRFWTWDKQQHRLWLLGVSRIAGQLGVDKLISHPVLLPTTILTKGVGIFKAHLAAAWHSGRKTPNPISRSTQRKLLHVPERTQRHYELAAGVKVKTNLAVGALYTPENIEKHMWQRGGAVFQFVDKQGKLGKQNGRYLAWQLPNSYVGPHQPAARGNLHRVNRQLSGLVHEGAQGNSDKRLNRRYFLHGAAAAKAIQRQQNNEVYWPMHHKHRIQLWSLFLNG